MCTLPGGWTRTPGRRPLSDPGRGRVHQKCLYALIGRHCLCRQGLPSQHVGRLPSSIVPNHPPERLARLCRGLESECAWHALARVWGGGYWPEIAPGDEDVQGSRLRLAWHPPVKWVGCGRKGGRWLRRAVLGSGWVVPGRIQPPGLIPC